MESSASSGNAGVDSLRKQVSSRWKLAPGSTAIVTGSSQGIGLAAIEELLGLGAEQVLIVARTEKQVTEGIERLQAEFAETSTKVHGIALDLSDTDSLDKIVECVTTYLGGRLDILVNNVGTNARKKIEDTTDEEYEKMLHLNVKCHFVLCKKLMGYLKASKGCVVNVASVAGIRSSGTGTIYALTKGAIVQFTRTLACEWGRFGIRVNCVCPWMTFTPLLKDAVAKDPSQIDEACKWTPMQRLAEPHEQGAVIAFLCLPASSYITGQVIACDGGISAQGFAGPCTLD